jgi:hypothetical protein
LPSGEQALGDGVDVAASRLERRVDERAYETRLLGALFDRERQRGELGPRADGVQRGEKRGAEGLRVASGPAGLEGVRSVFEGRGVALGDQQVGHAVLEKATLAANDDLHPRSLVGVVEPAREREARQLHAQVARALVGCVVAAVDPGIDTGGRRAHRAAHHDPPRGIDHARARFEIDVVGADDGRCGESPRCAHEGDAEDVPRVASEALFDTVAHAFFGALEKGIVGDAVRRLRAHHDRCRLGRRPAATRDDEAAQRFSGEGMLGRVELRDLRGCAAKGGREAQARPVREGNRPGEVTPARRVTIRRRLFGHIRCTERPLVNRLRVRGERLVRRR